VPNGVAGSRPAEQRQKEIPLSRRWLRPLAVWVALVFATLPGESSASTPAAAVTEPAVASVAPAHDLILCASINRSYVIGSKMVTLSGLYRRVADGSFEHFGPNLLYLSGVSLDPRDHRTIYLAMLNGALFSRDGGERIRIGTSWDMTEPKDIAVDPNAPDTVYLALPDGFAVSTDRGWTWTRREKGLSDRGKYTQAIEIGKQRDPLAAGAADARHGLRCPAVTDQPGVVDRLNATGWGSRLPRFRSHVVADQGPGRGWCLVQRGFRYAASGPGGAVELESRHRRF
jgi:hypothetical protein